MSALEVSNPFDEDVFNGLEETVEPCDWLQNLFPKLCSDASFRKLYNCAYNLVFPAYMMMRFCFLFLVYYNPICVPLVLLAIFQWKVVKVVLCSAESCFEGIFGPDFTTKRLRKWLDLLDNLLCRIVDSCANLIKFVTAEQVKIKENCYCLVVRFEHEVHNMIATFVSVIKQLDCMMWDFLKSFCCRNSYLYFQMIGNLVKSNVLFWCNSYIFCVESSLDILRTVEKTWNNPKCVECPDDDVCRPDVLDCSKEAPEKEVLPRGRRASSQPATHPESHPKCATNNSCFVGNKKLSFVRA